MEENGGTEGLRATLRVTLPPFFGQVLKSGAELADEGGMSNIKHTIASTWESMLGRVALIAVCAGWVPFTLLNMAQEALTR